MGGGELVEIKLSIGEDDVAPARARLGWADDTAVGGDIWFCDVISGKDADGNATLELFDRNLIVRLRHWFHDDGESDCTVKFRGTPPLQLPTAWAEPDDDHGYKIEGDWTGESRKESASLKQKVAGHDITSSVAHGKPLANGLFSDRQRQLAEALGGIRWKELEPLGPIHALRWDAERHDGLGAKLAGEQWIAGDLRFLELSIRVKEDEALEWQGRFTDWADHEKLGASAVGTTKTEAVLHHFASRP